MFFSVKQAKGINEYRSNSASEKTNVVKSTRPIELILVYLDVKKRWLTLCTFQETTLNKIT